jgi:hypothetical protein
MDSKEKIRALVQSMDEAQLGTLGEELGSAIEGRRRGIAMEDITVERLRDPQFAAEVRAELESVLKGMR